MKCAKCGGNIKFNQSCEKCGIEFREMLKFIRHDEICRLINRIADLIKNRQNTDLEASLLACELLNSNLIFPIITDGNAFAAVPVSPDNKKFYIPLFTDMDTYSEFVSEFDPLTGTFDKILTLMDDDCEGFVINPNSIACELTKDYINRFFKD